MSIVLWQIAEMLFVQGCPMTRVVVGGHSYGHFWTNVYYVVACSHTELLSVSWQVTSSSMTPFTYIQAQSVCRYLHEYTNFLIWIYCASIYAVGVELF